jgi:hypothetical protein
MSWLITPALKTLEGIPWNQIPADRKWTPADITTALWLDAADATTLFTTDIGSTQATNGEVVGRWADKSGNNRNATVATGTLTPVLQANGLNTLPAIYFNGNNQLDLPSGFLNGTTAFTIAMVMRGPLQQNDAVFGPRTANSTGLEMVWTNSAGFPTLLRINGVNKITSGLWSTTNAATITTITASASATAGWLNGSSVNAVSGTGITALTFNGQYSLASYSNSISGQGITGATVRSEIYISEFIIAESSISQPDREKLEGYLAHKWGLTANLPGDHPYKVIPPAP